MNKIIIFLFLIFTANVTAKEISINITGIAKVGKECFLNLSFQDQSKLFSLKILIY